MKRKEQTTAEILVIGNELLNGTTLDSNSHWLSKELARLGIKVERKTTVRDEMKVIIQSFNDCFSRTPNWLFSIGGLGPTYDDMTIQALGLAIGKKLKLDTTALKMLNESRRRRAAMLNRPVGKILKTSLKMAKMPQGSIPLYNPLGSAPGVYVQRGRTKSVSVPGVPAEMKAIFRENVKPMLRSSSTFFMAEKWLETTRISESKISSSITKIAKKYKPLVYIKSHPMGFRRGSSLLRIQITLSSPGTKKQESLKSLGNATSDVIEMAKRLGGSVRRLNSV